MIAHAEPHRVLSLDRLYSGVCSNDRNKRILMILQAYVDDSGSDALSRVYALGRLVAPLKNWGTFPDKWIAARREKPPRRVGYFKASEAASFTGQFANFNIRDRDARIVRLAKVIPEHASFQFAASLKRSDYDEMIAHDVLPEYRDPYFLLALAMVVSGSRILLDLFPRAKQIDFFFDRQGKLGSAFKEFFDKRLAPLLPHLGECRYVSSQTCLPLQAADMVASRTRTDADVVAIWSAAHVFLDQIPQIPPLRLTRSYLTKMIARSKLKRGLNRLGGSD
jgi:hypothetical protein